MRVARQVGTKQAAKTATSMIKNAEPSATGLRGLTLYNRPPIN